MVCESQVQEGNLKKRIVTNVNNILLIKYKKKISKFYPLKFESGSYRKNKNER